MKNTNSNGSAIATIIIIVIIIIMGYVLVGPKGCDRRYQSWKAEAHGSDWLVVQYAQDGSIITTWELIDMSITSEEGSDGIYFIDNDGNVIHLSGHYVYAQIKHGGMFEMKDKLMKGWTDEKK